MEQAVTAQTNRELASWLLAQRLEIEKRMQTRLGAAAPAASGPEAETLRRFRTFTSAALMRGQAPRPVLEGLRPNERRVMALLTCWAEAASELAGPEAGLVASSLAPLLDAFRLSIRTTGRQRKSSGRPRATRRAISAAIDRIADLFFAIDADTGEILDANPAAGSSLGVARDALIGLEFNAFVPEEAQGPWWTAIDAVAEGQENQVFVGTMADRDGRRIRLDASATRHLSKQRVVALVVARPSTLLETVPNTSIPDAPAAGRRAPIPTSTGVAADASTETRTPTHPGIRPTSRATPPGE